MPHAPEPRARAVLLGASNLTQGLPQVVDRARAALGAPLEVFAALGRGRSYGVRSSFLVRSLPGIDASGMWAELERRPRLPTAALLTDVGNDLAFGARAQQILGWVELALGRLEAAGAAPVVLTALPLANLRALAAWKFELVRRVVFPGHPLERARVVAEAEALDAGLRDLARRRGLVLVEPQASWYGFDPIHVARSRRAQAWGTILAPFGSGAAAPGALGAGGLGWRSELLVPAERRFLRWEQRRAQPCARLADGTSVHLY